MIEDTKKNNQLVKARTSSLQKRDSNIVSRGLSDLALLGVEKTKIADKDRLFQAKEWFGKGNKHRSNKEYDKAIEAFTSAIVVDPNYVDAYDSRGIIYNFIGQYDRALEDYNKVIALNPNYVNAHYRRGNIYFYNMKGQYDMAIENYNKVIQLDPNGTTGYFSRGEVYYRKGQYDRAIEDYNKVIQLDPDDVQAYYKRGLVYYKLRNKSRAISDFQKACDFGLEVARENLENILQGKEKILQAEEWFEKGYYHHRIKNEYNQEIEAYTNAISLDPSLAKAYGHRGNAYYDKGQYDSAIEDYNKALGLNPYLIAVYNDRGLAYERLGNKSMAISDFQKACDLGLKIACKSLQRVLKQK